MEQRDNPAVGGKAAPWYEAAERLPVRKTPISIRLDADVVDWLRSQGRGWQSRANAVLRAYMDAKAQRP